MFPDITGNLRLKDSLCDLLAALPFVQRVLVFGSFARGEADRWSDIDLLVVTANRMQFWEVFTTLSQHRHVLWRSRFVPQCDPSGGYILGIVFEGESIFHNVDLNFMTLAEYHMPEALNRFGTLKEVYTAETLNSHIDDGTLPTTEAEDSDDKRIFEGFHFTRKALKKILRGQAAHNDLRQRSDQLHHILNDYTPDVETPYGKIGWLAHQYLAMAEALLRQPIKS